MSFHILYDCAFLLIYGCDLMLFKRTFGKGEEMNQDYTKTQKLTISAICIALYLVVMLCTQSFAFGQYQVRIATALYGLSYIFPFLVVPFGIANVISNLVMGGLGPVDAIGGFFMGVLTSGVIAMGRRYGLGCWIVASNVTAGSGSSCLVVQVIAYSLRCFGCKLIGGAVHFRYYRYAAGQGVGKSGCCKPVFQN